MFTARINKKTGKIVTRENRRSLKYTYRGEIIDIKSRYYLDKGNRFTCETMISADHAMNCVAKIAECSNNGGGFYDAMRLIYKNMMDVARIGYEEFIEF